MLVTIMTDFAIYQADHGASPRLRNACSSRRWTSRAGAFASDRWRAV